MAVGEVFLSAFIQVLFQQLASAATMALARREKVESHFKKLSQSLSIIKAVLDDAEEKQFTEISVKLWLESLRDLAYDLDDLLDEIETHALVQDSEEQAQNCKRRSRVCRFIPTCSSYMPGALVSNYRLMSRIKGTNNCLQDIVKQRVELKLVENVGGSCSRSTGIRPPSTSLVNESHVYGLDEDKENVIDMLLGNEVCHDDVSVIPIVGFGGIGKTTLAQIVYNDMTVKDSFHVRAWVSVTEKFDLISITKTIYDSVTGSNSESHDLDKLQVSLKDELAKSRFLIVLDDVWNEDYGMWDKLYCPFQFGLPGSRIIVTTRIASVASMVGSPRTAYHMKLLTDENCLSLLAQHARTSFDEVLELRDVGLGLAKKCKGLPLAAKTLGGLLRSKETKEDWEKVLSSKIWDLPEPHNILPVLRLSYQHLPSHLKHLFAYCSIFPKDYKFDRDELVLLWMGEGFLEQPNPTVRKEELGLEYFNELLSRSFFQRLGRSDSRFVMHDLINELAQFVAGERCYRLDEKMDTNQEYHVPEKARHSSFLRHEHEVLQKFHTFYQVQGLRTFLPMPVDDRRFLRPQFYLSNRILVELVPKLNSLRVLSLSWYRITELPSSICNLLHLRYLNLSGTLIVTLPYNLSALFHLQTLSLRNCRRLCKLPRTLGNLSNLRHLDNSNTDQLKDMPIEIGNLRNLQTLPKIVLNKDGGCLGLKQLRYLRHLRGSLAIFQLQNVMDIEDVKEANFRCKNDLDELQLWWGSEIDNSNDKIPEEDVIDHLLPHENLKSLRIEFYRGSNFPSWIGDPAFHKLSSISIVNCSECSSLPPLGQLPELKHLLVKGMPKIKQVGTEFYGTGTIVTPFPKLKNLKFDHMPEWQKWTGPTGSSCGNIEFPNVQRLSITSCGKVAEVSPLTFPTLRTLNVKECSMVLLERFSGLESLIDLEIESIFGLSHLPVEVMRSLVALEVLECRSCNELLSLWPEGVPLDQNLARLWRLVIASCSQLVSLGQGDHQLPPNLEVLDLRDTNLDALPNNLSELESLRELIISNCQRFVAFPENGIPRMLKYLVIQSCNSLESLPANISGLEWLKIKDCSSLRTWAVAHFPATLKELSIDNCMQLEAVSDGMFPESSTMLLEYLFLWKWLNFSNLLQRLHGFAHLVRLNLMGCDGLEHFPEHGLPSGLRDLSIVACPSLTLLPAKISTMTSLVSLELEGCPRLDNFPRCDLPPNLTSLTIVGCENNKHLSKWGLHRLASLQEFTICDGFDELEQLGEDDCLFPPSLIRFSIAGFPKLTSLGKVLENLTLLRHLSIEDCQNLNVLPSEALLEKLCYLEITFCPLLRQRCAKDKGDYWPTIAGIPEVDIIAI